MKTLKGLLSIIIVVFMLTAFFVTVNGAEGTAYLVVTDLIEANSDEVFLNINYTIIQE